MLITLCNVPGLSAQSYPLNRAVLFPRAGSLSATTGLYTVTFIDLHSGGWLTVNNGMHETINLTLCIYVKVKSSYCS